MFYVIGLWFKSLVRDTGKYILPVIRLSRVKLQGGTRIDFPLFIRGKGPVSFGKNLRLQKHAYLGIDGKFAVGDNALIGSNTQIIVEKGGELSAGKKFEVEGNCIIRTSKKFEAGDDVFIASGTTIFSREKGYIEDFHIGSGSHIANNCIIDISGGLTIGDNVAIASNCTIYTHNHKYDDVRVGSWQGGVIIKPVFIEDGAWIGSNVVILPGVRVGRRSVVAAGSVVTKNLEAECVYGGNPARVIKKIQPDIVSE